MQFDCDKEKMFDEKKMFVFFSSLSTGLDREIREAEKKKDKLIAVVSCLSLLNFIFLSFDNKQIICELLTKCVYVHCLFSYLCSEIYNKRVVPKCNDQYNYYVYVICIVSHSTRLFLFFFSVLFECYE